MLNVSKTTISTGTPVYQKVIELAQGGFTLNDSAFAAGESIPAGAAIGFDESTRIAKVAKMAVVYENAANNVTVYKVKKGHLLKVGQNVKTGAGTAYAITAIDKTNANYDTITVGTTLGIAVVVGDAIFVSDAGYSGVKGLLYQDAEVDANGIASVSVVLRGTVYDRRITPVATSVKTTLSQIIFSQSY